MELTAQCTVAPLGGAPLPAGAPAAWRCLLPPPGAVWSSREPERPDFSTVPWSGHSRLLRVESVAPSSTGSNSSHRKVMFIVEFLNIEIKILWSKNEP